MDGLYQDKGRGEDGGRAEVCGSLFAAQDDTFETLELADGLLDAGAICTMGSTCGQSTARTVRRPARDAAARYVLDPGFGRELMLPTKTPYIDLGPDTPLHLRPAGGGGYGDPGRDPAHIAEGLKDGYVNRKGARADYGFTGDPGEQASSKPPRQARCRRARSVDQLTATSCPGSKRAPPLSPDIARATASVPSGSRTRCETVRPR